MKNFLENIAAFITINACNYVFWSAVSWNINPGEWGWFARLIAIIILLASFGVFKYGCRNRKQKI